MSNIERKYAYHDDGVLPAQGEYGVTYLTLYSSEAGNIYDGWIWDPNRINYSETVRTFGYRNPRYPDYCWDDEVIVDLSNAQTRQESSSDSAQGRIVSFNTNVSDKPILLRDIDVAGMTEEEREARATTVLFTAIPLVKDAYIQANIEIAMKMNLSPDNTIGNIRVEAFYIINNESDRTMRPHPINHYTVTKSDEYALFNPIYFNLALNHEDHNYIGVKLIVSGGTAEIGISDDPDYGDAIITITSFGMTGDNVYDKKPVSLDIYGKSVVPPKYKLKESDYTVLCTYDTGEVYEVTRLCEFTPPMGSKVVDPVTTLTANYQGLTASMSIVLAQLESIELIGLTDFYGDTYTLNRDDYIVIAYYNTGDTMDVTDDEELIFDPPMGTVIDADTTLTATYSPEYMHGSTFEDSLDIAKHAPVATGYNFANGLIYTLYDDNLVDITGNANNTVVTYNGRTDIHEYIKIPNSIQTAMTSRSVINYRMRWNASGEISGLYMPASDSAQYVTFVNFSDISIKPYFASTPRMTYSVYVNPIIMYFYYQKTVTEDNIDFLSNVTYVTVQDMFGNDIPVLITTNYMNPGQDQIGDMSYCFDKCEGLRSTRPLRNWKVTKVNRMDYTFADSFITNVDDISDWDTSYVQRMTQTFENCKYLSDTKGLRSWNTSNVTDFAFTFRGCDSLESAEDIGLWDSSSAESIGGMFYYSGLKTLIGLSEFLLNAGSNTEQEYIAYVNLFQYSKLINLFGLPSNLFTNGKIKPSQLFLNCRDLETLDGSDSLDFSRVTDMSVMFGSCRSLADISACRNWDVSNISIFTGLFSDCNSLLDITPTANWDLSLATSVKAMFYKRSVNASDTYTWSDIESWRCNSDQFSNYLDVLTNDVVFDLMNSQYYQEPHLRVKKAYVENQALGKEYRITSNSMFSGRDIFELVKISNLSYHAEFLNPNATPAWYRERIEYYVSNNLI